MTALAFPEPLEAVVMPLRLDQRKALEAYKNVAGVDYSKILRSFLEWLAIENATEFRAIEEGRAMIPPGRRRGAAREGHGIPYKKTPFRAEDNHLRLVDYLAANAGVATARYFRAALDLYFRSSRSKACRAAAAKLEVERRPWRRALGRKKTRRSAGRARRAAA